MNFQRRQLTLQDRIDLYHATFPNLPLPMMVIPTKDGGKITGAWEIGHLYAGSRYYGSYPGNMLQRVCAMFPDLGFSKGETHKQPLHMFSGSLPRGSYLRFDGREFTPQERVDNAAITGDAENAAEIIRAHPLWKDHKFYGILADPPYSLPDAIKYGYPKLVNYKKVLGECYKLLEPGGWYLHFATRPPIHCGKYWIMRLFLGIGVGSNKLIRGLWGYEKRAEVAA